jgi:hypothetical protein
MFIKNFLLYTINFFLADSNTPLCFDRIGFMP